MAVGCGNHRSPGLRAACCVLAAACLPCLGCLGDHSARRWLDPLGLTSKQSSSEQPEFRQRVAKDPFPSASQVGLAMPPKTETKE